MSRITNEIKHFTKLSHIWWGAKTIAGQKRYDIKYQRFNKLAKPAKNEKILEIGCGDGEFTQRLIKLSNNSILGTDLTPEVIKRAKANFKKSKNVEFKVDNSEKSKIKNNSFDIVCGISILHHMNWKRALLEAKRILKKNGRIFFTEPNYYNPFIHAALHSKYLRKKYEFSPDETALIRWEVEKYLKEVSFKNVKVLNFDFLHPNTPKDEITKMIKLSNILEKTPVIKEISGSLIIYAQK